MTASAQSAPASHSGSESAGGAPGTLEEAQVRAMFDRIAGLYDRMNSVMTAGLHRHWRRRAIVEEISGFLNARIAAPAEVAKGLHASKPNGDFGQAVALSTDGNTALIGGPGDNNDVGAAWALTR